MTLHDKMDLALIIGGCLSAYGDNPTVQRVIGLGMIGIAFITWPITV